MGEILGIGVTHYPGLIQPDQQMAGLLDRTLNSDQVPDALKDPAKWPEPMRKEWADPVAAAKEHRRRLVNGFRKAREALDAFNPDVVLIWGDDQYENFREDGVPSFCVFLQDAIESRPYARAGREGRGGGVVAFGMNDDVGWFAPEILLRPSAARIRPRLYAVHGEDAEGRHPVLAEILVLVVAPDQHDIGVEGVERLADLAEAADQPLPMLDSRGNRVGPFPAHRFGPARRVLHFLRHLIAVEGPLEEPGHRPVRLDEARIMRDADTENLAHVPLLFAAIEVRHLTTNAGTTRGCRSLQVCSRNPARPSRATSPGNSVSQRR